ncbi:hypothetical protein EHS13_28945 [Paenibacillus psychroresistens]|uniref:Uncharacterized protein n=1 Tax=Paenibacillus psychroresistens TaxID=1778678 RepID=A0A6B8RS90_9BACL|nr:hypothetical protein [Paenibacillus psychroresistens]QGQ98622.1 hypothetical protein EHS13_28945 [Paenibacillus psychroresistens]
MNPLQEALQILEIDHFENPNVYALRLNGKRVFVNKWDTGTSFLKEIKQEMLWQFVGLLKSEPGVLSSISIEDFLMVKYIKPYIIRINFPPTSSDYYVDIYKIGSPDKLDNNILQLWEDKSAYYWLRDFINEITNG